MGGNQGPAGGEAAWLLLKLLGSVEAAWCLATAEAADEAAFATAEVALATAEAAWLVVNCVG